MSSTGKFNPCKIRCTPKIFGVGVSVGFNRYFNKYCACSMLFWLFRVFNFFVRSFFIDSIGFRFKYLYGLLSIMSIAFQEIMFFIHVITDFLNAWENGKLQQCTLTDSILKKNRLRKIYRVPWKTLKIELYLVFCLYWLKFTNKS